MAPESRGRDGKMKERCQAVVIRVAPDASSGEMLNIGVVLHSPSHRYLAARFTSTWKRVTDAFPDADAVHLRRVASSISSSCDVTYSDQLSLTEPPADVIAVVRKIVPDDDASLLLSAPLAGVTVDPERTLGELFERFVVRGEATEKKVARADEDVWRVALAPILRQRRLLDRLQTHWLKSRHYEERFDHAWKNGVWNVARPLSLDLRDASEIPGKAASWTGRIRSLDPGAQHTNVIIIVGLPALGASRDVRDAADHGLGLLRDQLADQGIAEVMLERDAERLAERIEADLAPPTDEPDL